MRRFVRQTRAGFIALASVAALIHLVGVANTPGRVSTLAHGAGRGDDALTFLGPGARRRVLSSHCLVGQKYDSVGDECISCAPGQTSDGGSDATCDPCLSGEYSNVDTSWACTPCPAGNFSSSPTGSCDACAAGTYQDLTGQTSCTDCAAGNFSSSTGSDSCDVCAAGTYQDQVGQSSCTDCAPGEYQDEAGQSSCTNCAAGKYQPLTGQTSQSSCINCPAGSISAAVKAPSCDACAVGEYQDEAGQTSCTDCAPGKYQDLTGQTSCTDCPVGNYSASTKSPSCAACAAGEYQGQVGQTSCTDCLAGYFSAVEGRHRCDRCELGFHSEAGQSECTRCTTGFPCPEDRPKYLELLVVNDQRRCAEFTAFATISSTERAEMHAHTAAVVESAAERFSNGLSQGLTVVLVGQEDWCAGDELTSVPEMLTRDYYRKQEGAGETSKPETNTSVLLDALGVWRDENLESLPSNDVVYLFTGRDLDGSFVGASHAYSVCGDDAKHCGTIVSGNRTSSLGVNECATGEDGVVRCCHAHRSGAVAMVSKSDATSAAGLVLAHEIGHQLGMSHDGDTTCSNMPGSFIMAEQFEHVNASADTWSPCSVATYEAQVGDYECLAHGLTTACGNGIVDENEECDCGLDDCSAIDPCCDGSTCQLKNQTCAQPPAPAPPPPAYYKQDDLCTSGCGVGYDIGISRTVINVRADQCLQCSGGHGLLGSPAGYRESDCKLDAAPYKGWKYSDVEPNEDEEDFRYEDCHWSGCGGDACDSGEVETKTETCAVGTNRRCCKKVDLWVCCGLLDCTGTAYPPPVPPSPEPPPPLPPSPPPPPPIAEGWKLMGGSINGSAAFDFSGSAISMSLDGERVAIGSSLSDEMSKTNAGHVRVFGWDGSSSWDQVGADIDGEGALDQFGRSVSLSDKGQYVAIGAPFWSDTEKGRVRVFELNGGTSWSEYGEAIEGESNWYWFGWKLTMSTVKVKRLAVAAFSGEASGNKNGIVRVHRYKEMGQKWDKFGVDSDIVEENIGDETGFSLELSDEGDHLAIGSAFNNNTGGECAGHVRVFKWSEESGWTQMGYALNGSSAFERAGASLALSGDGSIVAVGVPGADDGRGRVEVYEFVGSEWQQRGVDLYGDNDGDQFGFSLSLSTNGTRITVGAKQNDAAGNDAGSIRVYEWKTDLTWSDYPTKKWVAVSLDILAEAAGDSAGFAVSMAGDGSRVAIAAPESDANGTDSGQVRVYELERWDAIAPWPPPVSAPSPPPPSPPPPTPPPPPPPSPPPLTATWYQMGADLNGEAVDDNHGGAVSLSGDGMRLAVGAKKHDDGGADTGHTRVYQWLSSSWKQLGGDLGDEVGFAAGDEAGSAVSLSKDGSRVAVGAAQDGSSGKGKVGVYQYVDPSGVNDDPTSGVWTQLGDDLEGDATDDRFGSTITLSGSGARIAIGAPYNDPTNDLTDAGHVQVWEWNALGGTEAWRPMGAAITGKVLGDLSGWSVSLSDDGSRLAFGGIEEEGYGVWKGHVRVFEWNATADAWVQLGEDFTGDVAEDYFGTSVSLSADGAHVAIGASEHDSGEGEDKVSSIGHVKVYQYNETSGLWLQLGEDIDGEKQRDKSGASISLSADGTRVAIGEPGSDDAALNAGRVRIYQYDPASNWTIVGTAQDGEAAGDNAGVSVSISDDGERFAVGSSENSNGVGRVWVYSLVANPPPPPPPSPPPSPPPPSPPPSPPPPSPPPPLPPPPSPPPPSPPPPSPPPPSPPPSPPSPPPPSPPPSPSPPSNPTSPPPPPPFPPGGADIDVMEAQLVIKKAQAETARDTMLSGLSGDDKEKATLLADALVAGADITEVTVTQDAASAVIACNAVYEEMGVDQSLGFCEASLASGRRRLLADYSVSILLITAKNDQSIIDAAVAKLSGATVSKVEGSLAVATLLSAIPGVDGDSDEFKDFYTKAKDAADLAEDIYEIENPPSSESDDDLSAEEQLALFITVPLVTFILCCVLLYYRRKVAELCGRACCFWRRGGARPSGSSARASQYASRAPEPTRGGAEDEPAPTPDSARWASSRPVSVDPWTEPQSLSPFGAAPPAISQQPFPPQKRTDVSQSDAPSVSSDDSISSDDSDPFGGTPGRRGSDPFGATPAATPAAALDPAFSDLSDDSDEDSDDDPFGEAPTQPQQPFGGAQSSQQDMDMGETLSFGETSDGDDGSDKTFGSSKSGSDDPFADPFDDPNSP